MAKHLDDIVVIQMQRNLVDGIQIGDVDNMIFFNTTEHDQLFNNVSFQGVNRSGKDEIRRKTSISQFLTK